MAILEIEVEKNTPARIGKEKTWGNESRLHSAAHLGSNPREILQHNFNLAASAMGLSEEQKLLLQTPFREVKVESPSAWTTDRYGSFWAIGLSTMVLVDRLTAASAISQP